MAVYNIKGGEISVKIVYYGPGLSGKTTNLEYIYSKLPRENKGKMVSMKTRTDRTLFFDFLPLTIEKVNDMTVKFLIYTVPGQVYYNATRKLVLKGVDALVFVADSTPGRMSDNIESLENLETNLNEIGKSLNEVPWVIQYNKRDVPDPVGIDVMERELNRHGKASFEAVAIKGTGVYDTFESIAREVFGKIEAGMEKPEAGKSGAGTRSRSGDGSREIEAEVVSTSSGGVLNSEAGESESFESAEETDREEQESVSEFVDKFLAEDEKDNIENENDPTGKGYEDYGHLVELGDNQEEASGQEEEESDSAVATEFINDPLEKLNRQGAGNEEMEKAKPEPEEDLKEQPETITIPVNISRESIKDVSNLKIVLHVTLE